MKTSTPKITTQYTQDDCEKIITQASRIFESGSFAAAHVLYRQAKRAREIFGKPIPAKKVSSF